MSVILAEGSQALLVYLLLLCGFMIILRVHITGVLKRIRPFFYYLPIMITLYIGFSLWLSTETYRQILITAGWSFFRLLLIVAIMSLYLEQSGARDFLNAVRSLWVKMHRSWRWVDDLFLFLSLTLRFFPGFQREWDNYLQVRRALGFDRHNSRWDRIRLLTRILPGLLLQHYNKADDTAMIMKMRGYGRQIPRGLAHPLPFGMADGLWLIGTTLLFLGVNISAAI